MGDEAGKATRGQILQFMTTEHFTLQTAKSATVAEANGREKWQHFVTNAGTVSVVNSVLAGAFARVLSRFASPGPSTSASGCASRSSRSTSSRAAASS